MLRQIALVVAVVFLIRLPFLNQAIQGDDVYYLAGAEHAQIDLLHPNHARHLFVIQLGETKLSRDDLLLALRARNIGASVHYAPLHRMPLYHDLRQQALPNTEDVCGRIMTLPVSASMPVEDADYVVRHIAELIKS